MKTTNRIFVKYEVDGVESRKWVELPYYVRDMFNLTDEKWSDRLKYANPSDSDYDFVADEFLISCRANILWS